MAKQISEEQIELLVERLIDRINKANTTFLKSIGSSIKEIRKLTPSQAHQLVQMLKYGGKYEDIVRQIAKYTNLNIQDIDDIFSNYAKKDQLFYEKFYEYKDIPFTLFEQNMALKRQTQALANITKQAMYNFTQSNAIGYTINGEFFNLRNTYEKLLDEALLNVSQGKETFDQAMSRILKDIGGSGLKYLDYENGKQMRLDSMTRQYLKDGLRNLHNENQKLIGEEFGADGVEISVHSNPAPDHELVQGRQFSNEEFDKFQNDMDAVSYDGMLFPAISDETGHDRRSISEYNCYHTIFPIILGVSDPEYSNKQLQQIIDDNNKGFELDGKHYTNYEGTQMQRKLENKIREQKDIQILAKESGETGKELVEESQYNIMGLTRKYKQLSDISGLPTKAQRTKVSNYKIQSTKEFDKKVKELYNIGTREENAQLYFKAKRRQENIQNGEFNLNIIESKQLVHNINSDNYVKGKSYFNISLEEEQELIYKYAGSGFIPNTQKGNLTNKEICTTNKIIGTYINKNLNKEIKTNSFVIHYSKDGVHIVPADYREVNKK